MDFTISSDILCELLEVSINLILYTREVYPSRIFRRRKKYNIPVQMYDNYHCSLLKHFNFIIVLSPLMRLQIVIGYQDFVELKKLLLFSYFTVISCGVELNLWLKLPKSIQYTKEKIYSNFSYMSCCESGQDS
ncbi:hypothetical protein Avbf_00848 [Armadillidium vulgare]|nr:hypothetical protein Avbf_00848 [Armadillidium vulgare]